MQTNPSLSLPNSAAKMALAFLVLSLLFGAVPLWAQTQTSSADTVTVEPSTAAELTGFRSAKFGMDEAAVRAAIKADFGLEGDAISVGLNTVERTRVMTISAPEVLKDGGVSQVSYIFGYKSKTLIQVGILWSAQFDPTLTEATLQANGDILRAYFLGENYVPATVAQDVVLPNGLLLFRGGDAEGRTALLLLQGRFEQNDGTNILFPETLTLLYSVSPDNPDILKLESGDF